MIRYELRNIEPFNDVYYMNCYKLALFTAVKYFNGSIFSFMANDYFVYTLEETQKGSSLIIEGREVISIVDMVNNNCINVEPRFDYCEDIVGYLKDTIMNGDIIILPVDGFYYKHPYHDLFYLKEHHHNAMLVYGFDSEREVFKTTETNGFQWNTPKCHYKHEISFEEMIMGHEGVVKYLQSDPPRPTITRLYKDNSNKAINDNPRFYDSILLKNLKDHKDDILKGLDNILFFAENINQFNIRETISFDNLVASASNCYRIKHILGEECKSIPTLENIVDTWAMIRNRLLKCEYKGIECDKNILSSKLYQIYELENLLYEGLFS